MKKFFLPRLTVAGFGQLGPNRQRRRPLDGRQLHVHPHHGGLVGDLQPVAQERRGIAQTVFFGKARCTVRVIQ